MGWAVCLGVVASCGPSPEPDIILGIVVYRSVKVNGVTVDESCDFHSDTAPTVDAVAGDQVLLQEVQVEVSKLAEHISAEQESDPAYFCGTQDDRARGQSGLGVYNTDCLGIRGAAEGILVEQVSAPDGNGGTVPGMRYTLRVSSPGTVFIFSSCSDTGNQLALLEILP